jgi:hypothetical protein
MEPSLWHRDLLQIRLIPSAECLGISIAGPRTIWCDNSVGGGENHKG